MKVNQKPLILQATCFNRLNLVFYHRLNGKVDKLEL